MSADISNSDGAMDRRTFLRGAAGAGTLAVAGASAPAAARDSGGDLDSWFEGVSNYDGVVDETGNAEVTVEVGAKGNNGAFAFGPTAVRVDPRHDGRLGVDR
jgi:plastocyanin